MSNYDYTENYCPDPSLCSQTNFQNPCHCPPPKPCNPLANCCKGLKTPPFDYEKAFPMLTRVLQIYDYKTAFGIPATAAITNTNFSIDTNRCTSCCTCTTCTLDASSTFKIESICTRLISATAPDGLGFTINGRGLPIIHEIPNIYTIATVIDPDLNSENCDDCDKGTKATLISEPFPITFTAEHTICGTVSTHGEICKFHATFTDSTDVTTDTDSSIFIQDLCLPPNCGLAIPTISLFLCYKARLMNPTIIVTVPDTTPVLTLSGTIYIVPTVEAEVDIFKKQVVLVNDFTPCPHPAPTPEPCCPKKNKCKPTPNCPHEPLHHEPITPCDCE